MNKFFRAFLLSFSFIGLTAPGHAQFAAQQTWVQTATGTANAIVLGVPNVANIADLVGVPVRFVVATTNTGATTSAIGGTAATGIRKSTGAGLSALAGGELVAGNTAVTVYNGAFHVLVSAKVALIPSSNSLLKFTTSGTYTPSVGVSSVFVQCWGSGGGASSPTAGSNFTGDGGGGAEFRAGIFAIVPGTPVSVTVGPGGAPGATTGGPIVAHGNPGNNGVASSFGSYLTANPGSGAPAINSFGIGGPTGNGGGGGSGGSGGFGINGEPGQGGASFGTSGQQPGFGGWSMYGGRAGSIADYGGDPGIVPGGGGQGGNGGGAFAGNNSGGAGGGGMCLVQELNN